MDTIDFKLIAIGFITGIINGLFGSGGGTIIVPALVFLVKMEDYKAHATAISIILPLSVISTIIYLKSNIVKFNIGYIIAIGGIIGSFIGAKLLKKIPNLILRKTFGIIIIITAIRMIIG
ncbi:MAG: sulfite exporter TauE/SafE family protein [Tissierellia bacterium]|nr:sulfite exporter TauE/SafE family protein [Tissierellia bacterium]